MVADKSGEAALIEINIFWGGLETNKFHLILMTSRTEHIPKKLKRNQQNMIF